MTLLQGARKASKTIAKGSLYVAGGLALGLPLIKGAQTYSETGSFMDSAEKILFEATGYYADGNRMVSSKLGEVVFRDIVGVGAIYAASKL